jgi:ABC-2 type transport system permease protein
MLKHLIRKEFLQIRRDRRMAPIIFVAPMLQLLIFGYAATLDVVEIPMVICDQDRSSTSRELVRRMEGADTFSPLLYVEQPDQVDLLLTRGDAGVALVIPTGLGERVLSGGTADVQLLVDGADSVTASQGLSAAVLISGQYAQDVLRDRLAAVGMQMPELPRLEPRVWYNPELKSRNYMVPALLGLILMLMTMMLTSMALVREKEAGTMEQLAVTPVRPVQLILGKLLPFVMIGFVQVTVITSVAVLWFRVPFEGSLLALYLMVLPFLLNTLGIGLMVSTVSSTQQQAMMTAMFFFMMPMIYFSGFVFPIESMPEWVQPVCYVVPLKYFLEIIRGIFLRGVGIEVLWKDVLALTVLGIGWLSFSVARFRKTVD